MRYADWIAVDWGTTRVRLWPMGAAGQLDMREARRTAGSPRDVDDLNATLLDMSGDVLDPDRETPVVVCGAAGAGDDWRDVAFRVLPCTPSGAEMAARIEVRDPRLKVWCLPGLSLAKPPAVMWGEETRIAGFVAAEPEFEGVLCMPGAQTHWVHVSVGEVISFMSFMTGDLFGQILGHPGLKSTVAPNGFEELAFLEAVSDALSRPERLPAGVLSLRAEAILDGLDPVTARSRLSGLLVGAELAGARLQWLGRDVVVIGESDLAGHYVAALKAQGIRVRAIDDKAMALAGLTAAWRELEGSTT